MRTPIARDFLARVRQRDEELRAGLGELGAFLEPSGLGLLDGPELARPAEVRA